MKAIFLIPLFWASVVMAQEPDTTSAIFKMRETERNFAKASLMKGRNAAFAEYFAQESVIFTDKWITNGKEFSKNSKSAPIVLKWEPEYMDIAESRDFGISTGPWEVQEYRPNTLPLATGYFLTVWKKQTDGEWKVILDGGSETPVADGPKHTFAFPAGADKPVIDPPVINTGQAVHELLEREKSLKTEWRKNLAPGMRMQLNGHLPSTNPDTINAWINKIDKSTRSKASGGGAASSGDMGFTYGVLNAEGTDAVKGHFVRIWKKKPGDDWKIALEMLNLNDR